jgi:hypothetical protein
MERRGGGGRFGMESDIMLREMQAEKFPTNPKISSWPANVSEPEGSAPPINSVTSTIHMDREEGNKLNSLAARLVYLVYGCVMIKVCPYPLS